MAYPGYKPVHEDFLTKIVEVHWPEEGIEISFFFEMGLTIHDHATVQSCAPAEGPITYPDVGSTEWHTGDLVSVSWDLWMGEKPRGFFASRIPESGDVNEASDNNDPVPDFESPPKLFNFPNTHLDFTPGPWQYTQGGFGGAFGDGPFTQPTGPRGDARINGEPLVNEFVETTAVTVLVHSDTFTGGPSCRGPNPSGTPPNYFGAHHSGASVSRDDFIHSNNLNYGEEYAQLTLDLSNTYVLADIGDGPEKFYVMAAKVSALRGGVDKPIFFSPPFDGENTPSSLTWAGFESWDVQQHPKHPEDYRPGAITFVVKCRKSRTGSGSGTGDGSGGSSGE